MAERSNAAANSTISLSQKLDKMIAGDLQDYNSWRSLISEIEKAPPEDIKIIALAYESFLPKFPLCHWHLEKYAYQKAKFCNSQEAVNIYEQAVEVAMFSVGFWADYFTFVAASFESPMDIRRLFERAISFVGRDYFCHVLWDKYMKYEFTQEGWSFLAQSYIWALRFPTKKLRFYYDNFNQFVANLEEEIGYESYNNNDSTEQQLSVPCVATELSKDEISLVIKDMLDSSNRPLRSKALDKYRYIGEEFYLEARQMDEKIKCFETKIQRHYFDVTPLDDDQLNTWHLYLDFIEKQDNLDRSMKLYERCLIPCANYPEFWMRYVEFLESKGGRELAISALARATQIFVKSAPEIHLFDARYKEHMGDAKGARAALSLCDPKSDSNFIDSIAAQANLERRLGNLGAASATYEKALKVTREKRKLNVLPSLYTHFAHFRFLITGNAAASRDILIEGIRQVPCCRLLLEELVKFAMTHEGSSHVNIIDSIIAEAILPGLDENEGLDAKDRENISCLFLEFVNLCGTTHDIQKGWNRHVKLFPQSLRTKNVYKPPETGTYQIGLTKDKKGHHGQEQVPELPANNEVHPGPVVRELTSLKDQSNSIEGSVRELSTKEVLSNGNESRECEPAYETSDGQGPMVASVEFPGQAKEIALTVRDSDLDFSYQSRGDEPGPMDISAEPGVQSKENVLAPPRSALEMGKSTETIESIRGYHSSLTSVQPDLDHAFNQPKHSVSLHLDSVKSQEKHYNEALKASCESERDGSRSRQHKMPTEVHPDPEEPSRLCEDSVEINNMVPSPGHATSRFQDSAQNRELKLQQSPSVDHHSANALNRKFVTSRQEYPARQQPSPSELRAVQEDKATELDQRMGVLTPPNSINTSGEQQPVSSQPVSYSQQSANSIASAATQQQWHAQQSLAMNQMMLQYHYQQQQLLQQQYQQQLHMQHPHFQMQQQYMNQQPYQVELQQQNQPQEQLIQQQQEQLSQQHHQHLQTQKGQEPLPNFQQLNEKQYQKSPDIAYQQQLAYQQHGSQEHQQLLWQQYQQYQSYQLLQQQLKEGSTSMQGHHMHQHQSQRQQDEHLRHQHHQQAHSQQNFTQNMSQNRQGSKRATPDYDAARPSESPRLGHSP